MVRSTIPDLSVLPSGKLDVLYGRFSPRRKAEECQSVENQREKLEGYARFRELPNPVFFADEELTADLPFGERPAGAVILKLMSEGRAASLIATRLDRLFRNGIDAYLSALRYREMGVSLRFLDFAGQELNLDSPAGRQFVWSLAGFAQFEREIIAERTSEAMYTRAARGQRMSSRIPYGWREDVSGPRHESKGHCLRLVKDPQEQGNIDLIVALHADQGKPLGARAIARELNKRGAYYRGKKWHHENVIRILVREGVYRPEPPRNGRFALTEELQAEYDRVDAALAAISRTTKKVAKRRRSAPRAKGAAAPDR